ncbi:MAG TPA: hypothetical protein VK838_01540 [Candidatus Limnocylindrales bacterium]|nr:hypothetical protein [Candidatus Limnocylindrales bacterium]
MLQMTDRAAELLRNLRSHAELPNEAGVRVFTETAETGQPTVSLGFAPDPAPGDQVGDHDGLRLFVAPELAEPLAEAVMDVMPGDGESTLVFRPATEDESGEASPGQ